MTMTVQEMIKFSKLGPTSDQRRVLYRLGVSRGRVALLKSTKAAADLITTLLATDARNVK